MITRANHVLTKKKIKPLKVSRIHSYLIAIFLTLLAIWIQFVLSPYVDTIVFLLLYPAILVSAWIGGLGPGLISTIISLIAANFFFVENSSTWPTVSDTIRLSIFFLLSVSVTIAISAYRKSYFFIINSRKELAESKEKLQEAVRARDEFIAIASHELKTPITTLKMQADIKSRAMKKGEKSFFCSDRMTKMIKTELSQIDRIVRLIDDMLDIGRLRTGKIKLNKEWFDFCPFADEVVSSLRPQIESSGCSLSIEKCEKVYGYWDKLRMEQVLTNLLTNASRYGSNRPISVLLTTDNKEKQLIIKVIDKGIGISPDNQERIFGRFERAISPSEVSGLGLGLYIVRQIVEQHGGQIYVESELGLGSTFIVELPTGGDDNEHKTDNDY